MHARGNWLAITLVVIIFRTLKFLSVFLYEIIDLIFISNPFINIRDGINLKSLG